VEIRRMKCSTMSHPMRLLILILEMIRQVAMRMY